MNYDANLSAAKHRATSELVKIQRDYVNADLHGMAGAIDDLNKAWDELTDCLVRQREERDRQILKLIDELAEAKKGKQ